MELTAILLLGFAPAFLCALAWGANYLMGDWGRK